MNGGARWTDDTIGDRAVVIGASIAGLLCAQVLAERYERVTGVDRDALPAGDEARRAVPQGRHVHALLPSGQACLDDLRPVWRQLVPVLAARLAESRGA